MKEDVVCNTGPLIALALLGRFELLAARFNQVWIPRAVERELLAGGLTAPAVAAFQAATWIRITDLNQPLDPVLLALLDRGEAEVLALAAERNIPRVLMDERKGRKIARTVLNLQPLGVARLLVDAQRDGQIPSAVAELERLRQAGYWLDETIIQWAARSLRQ